MCWVFYLLSNTSANLDPPCTGDKAGNGFKEKARPWMNGWRQESTTKDVQEQKEHMAAEHSEDGHPWDRTPSQNATQLKGGTFIWQLPAALPAFCCGSQSISSPWLCSQALSSSATSQPHPTAGPQPLPSFHSLPPRLHSFHRTQGSLSPVCISTLQVFIPWMCCSFLPHLHWWSDRFPPWEPQVYSLGNPVPEGQQGRAKPKPERPEGINSEQMLPCFFLYWKLAVQGLLKTGMQYTDPLSPKQVHFYWNKTSSFLLK